MWSSRRRGSSRRLTPWSLPASRPNDLSGRSTSRAHRRFRCRSAQKSSTNEFPSRGVSADVHGILMRVASLQDTLAGKVAAWQDPERRPSKRQKDLLDVIRLLESHPELKIEIPAELLKELPENL